MAMASVSKSPVLSLVPGPSRDRHDDDAYERIITRLNGVQAIGVLAVAELEQNTLSKRTWSDLWYFIGKVMDEVGQDAEILDQKRVAHRSAA